MELELARFGISADEFASVFDANPEAISKFSLFFLEKIIEARELKKTGETHLARRGLAVPEKLIDWFVTCALELYELERQSGNEPGPYRPNP